MIHTANDRMLRSEMKAQSVQACSHCNHVFRSPFEFKGRVTCPYCGTIGKYFTPDRHSPLPVRKPQTGARRT